MLVYHSKRTYQDHTRSGKTRRELKAQMEAEGLNQTELANRMGVTRARISQWLRLLQLPGRLLADVENLGDCWRRRKATERML